MRRIPGSATYTRLPIGATVLLYLFQKAHPTWPGWAWGVLWTFAAFVWAVVIFDVVKREHITDAEWRRVFPDKEG
jgi:membrane protein YdbS with pleckstrin-like domain